MFLFYIRILQVQDAHNLAWKLAVAVKGHLGDTSIRGEDNSTGHNTTLGDAKSTVELQRERDLMYSYHRERRPVAISNMLLSERNFNRTAAVAELLGLPAHAPHTVATLLEGMGLPKWAKAAVFDAVVTTGQRMQLGTLVPNSGILARSVPMSRTQKGSNLELVNTSTLPNVNQGDLGVSRRHAVKGFLQGNVNSGGRHLGDGLPLLFPRHDLGFVYGCHKSDEKAHDTRSDIEPYEPRLIEGGRLPHAWFWQESGHKFGLEGSRVQNSVVYPVSTVEPHTTMISTLDLVGTRVSESIHFRNQAKMTNEKQSTENMRFLLLITHLGGTGQRANSAKDSSKTGYNVRPHETFLWKNAAETLYNNPDQLSGTENVSERSIQLPPLRLVTVEPQNRHTQESQERRAKCASLMDTQTRDDLRGYTASSLDPRKPTTRGPLQDEKLVQLHCSCDDQWLALCKGFLNGVDVTMDINHATVAVLVRPDGHIQWLHYQLKDEEEAFCGILSGATTMRPNLAAHTWQLRRALTTHLEERATV